ncbi:MAG: copper homeostasis protein CutC [Dokdonella sp.]
MGASASPLLEIAANSLASALVAEDAGAGRVELCASLREGGLTPSYATIALARERLHIPLYVLIRPRAGDFLYAELELETMRRDIEACVRLGCDGVVIGALDAEGDIASVHCRALIAAAGPLGVTFHRAFDLTRDPQRALEAIIQLGCERVLTSGMQASASEGTDLIRALVAQAAARIIVMPGAGVDAGNIAALRVQTGATEFHASAKRTLDSRMRHRVPRLADMQSGEQRSDAEQIRRMLQALADSATARR